MLSAERGRFGGALAGKNLQKGSVTKSVSGQAFFLGPQRFIHVTVGGKCSAAKSQ